MVKRMDRNYAALRHYGYTAYTALQLSLSRPTQLYSFTRKWFTLMVNILGRQSISCPHGSVEWPLYLHGLYSLRGKLYRYTGLRHRHGLTCSLKEPSVTVRGWTISILCCLTYIRLIRLVSNRFARIQKI